MCLGRHRKISHTQMWASGGPHGNFTLSLSKAEGDTGARPSFALPTQISPQISAPRPGQEYHISVCTVPERAGWHGRNFPWLGKKQNKTEIRMCPISTPEAGLKVLKRRGLFSYHKTCRNRHPTGHIQLVMFLKYHSMKLGGEKAVRDYNI